MASIHTASLKFPLGSCGVELQLFSSIVKSSLHLKSREKNPARGVSDARTTLFLPNSLWQVILFATGIFQKKQKGSEPRFVLRGDFYLFSRRREIGWMEKKRHNFKIMLIIEESKKKDTYRRNTVYNKTVQPSFRWLHSFIVRGFYSLSLGLNLKSTLVVVVEE